MTRRRHTEEQIIAVAIDRNTLRYRSRRPDEAGLRTRIREMAERKRRYGCPTAKGGWGSPLLPSRGPHGPEPVMRWIVCMTGL